MATAIVDKIQKHVLAGDHAALAAYWGVVLKSARDEELDPGEVLTLLGNAGKTLEDLERDATAAERRIKLRAKLDGATALKAEHAKLTEELAAADREFQAAERKHKVQRQRLVPQLIDLNCRLGQARTAELDLQQSCADPSIIEEEHALAAARREVVEQLANAREREQSIGRDLAKLEKQNQAARDTYARHKASDQVTAASLKAELESSTGFLQTAQQRHRECLQSISVLEAEIASIEKASSAVRAAKLEP